MLSVTTLPRLDHLPMSRARLAVVEPAVFE
jgi:hypothetical protein